MMIYSMAATSSSSSKSSLSPYLSPIFNPIQEGNEEEEEDDCQSATNPSTNITDIRREIDCHHTPTPLHKGSASAINRDKSSSGPKRRTVNDAGDDKGVSCNKCRPGAREKTSVVPLDVSSGWKSIASSPNELFRSIFTSLVRRSPKSSDGSAAAREEQWKVAVAELTHKLVQATRKRDEAVLEVSRLKYSMSELEKKLNKLEVYCRNLKSGLDVCSSNSSNTAKNSNAQLRCQNITVADQKVVEHFLVQVSEARSSVRLLSRSLAVHVQQIGGKAHERISLLLQPYDVKMSSSRNPRGLLVYLEMLLNRAFFEDFESVGFERGGAATNRVLNPIERCEANLGWYDRLRGLTWEEVLCKGTRHYSEEFSRFCDRKMSEVVGMLGWGRAWPEPLLQAFFGASKAVWLVHLLANSVYPSLTIFRVDKGSGFDTVYMEDVGPSGGRVGRRLPLVPAKVRVMVAPGFYVYDNVVKCKVLCCRYNCSSSNNITTMDDGNNSNSNNSDQTGLGLTPSSPAHHLSEDCNDL